MISYREAGHSRLPHIVKLSGGRSSAMLLLLLLKAGTLRPGRGDAVVFNNTSAEHPATYGFAERCGELARGAGIPFFRLEFQTVEARRRGALTRVPTYRMTTAQPRGRTHPTGFHWRGEVYEEMVSWAGYVPNQYRRTCTKHLKLEPTRRFLQDWLSGATGIPQLGHDAAHPRIDPAVRYRVHRRHGGTMPEEVFRRKHAYCWTRPHGRPAARFDAFARGCRPKPVAAMPDGYVTLIGLRGDEQRRIRKVKARGPHARATAGEHIYMPLGDEGVTREDVTAFWREQPWDLELPATAGLSNCVYCFLKGGATLGTVDARMRREAEGSHPDFGPLAGTPSDLAWWMRLERTYGRNLEVESQGARGPVSRIAFFGAREFGYADVRAPRPGRNAPTACDCLA